MKRLSLRTGESWVYRGSLVLNDDTVSFTDVNGCDVVVARADIAAIALASGGAHPDDGELLEILSR